ncbi:D-sedoheptulose-7-phosphate isomerase [Herbiconiux flava]|uniref:Phosphoheptose isomerase n=1 Tax=Herbiconiux flava TaxID=881268 RepID=A0A852SS06_9MICO|nr:SIS domain-containing protein [Herbiconiux flava]NYD71748.1 phosphoheptose isomerase [Herbiconiux flava]
MTTSSSTTSSSTTSTTTTSTRRAPASVPLGTADRALLGLHLRDHARAMAELEAQVPVIERWGRELANRLGRGQRLLVAGNGGSAAEAQHLSSEIVGRFDGERAPFSALALNAESSSVTAIGNDYGFEQVFARQVTAHARSGDVVVLLSTSGRSPNLVAAARAGVRAGAATWALTGEGPNPLTRASAESLALPGTAASVQEAQLVAIHLLCRVFDHAIATAGRSS